MTDADFEDTLKMCQAIRIAYDRGLIPENQWQEIMAVANLWAKTAEMTERLSDDLTLDAEVIEL